MVTPGDPSCCLASSPAPDRTRFRYRMVHLAPLPPSRSLQGPPETEAATAMLVGVSYDLHGPPNDGATEPFASCVHFALVWQWGTTFDPRHFGLDFPQP